jgi:hypothetical protein
MRKVFIAAIFMLVPLAGFAEAAPSADTNTNVSSGISQILWISAGVVGGALIVDMLVGGTVTAPIVSMMHPAIQQARAAGAVFGEQIAAATIIRDNQARAAMAYALLVSAGGILGGWAVNRFVISHPTVTTTK